jgi:uncharacterized phage protein gp47/JayE
MVSPVAPTIGPNGISAPDFATILAYLTTQYQSIFGTDVYLGNDSQDGQLLALFARALADSNAAAVAVYNSFSPLTGQGNGLSSNVKINGLTRALPSASTCVVTIVGQANTVITNGQVTDVNGVDWALPASVTIPNAGTINVTATCTQDGAIAAGIGTLTKIKTPIYGWQTVTNAAVAVQGAPVESDAALRVRQSQSVALPAATIFEGVIASIASVTGVTRKRGYENATNSTDTNGVAARSSAIFVEGGDELTIAATIARKISPGAPLVGALVHTITDANGSTREVRFARPTNATITVALTVKALPGWTTSTETLIAQAVADFINELPIGDTVRFFDVSTPAKLVGNPYSSTFALTAMTLKKNAGSAAASDVALAYNEAPVCVAGTNVTFTVT